jgi:Zn-dependent protease
MNFSSLRQRWATLTRNQQIGVAVVGLLILYGLVAGAASGRGFLNPSYLLAIATIVFVSFPVHEFAHDAAAVALGDDTPRRQGRYTLNPMAHLDPLGAILILFTGFGWAKPVQWNPRNITIDHRLGSIIVAMAGPLSNLLLALIAVLLLQNVRGSIMQNYLFDFMQINILLFVFNLIPIPPLDGSHVLFAILPGNNFQLQMQLSRYGFMILLLIIFFAPNVILGPTAAITQMLISTIL